MKLSSYDTYQSLFFILCWFVILTFVNWPTRWEQSIVCNYALIHFFVLQAPEGENQPSTEVDLFVSSDKIMVLNTDLQVSKVFTK